MKRYLTSLCLLSVVVLTACQATHPEKSSPEASANKSTATTPRVAGHGASEADRQAFILELDADSDGRVTREEFEVFRKSRFNDSDVNRNGLLDEDEYVDEYAARLEQQIASERAAHLEQTVARFASLDKNKDGVISWEEYKASGDRAFAHFDRDNKGVVKANGKAKPVNRSRSVLSMPTSHVIHGFLELYDEDADGVVTKADFDRLRQQAFAETDTDNNGTLSADEYQVEFENRLDRQADRVRELQIKQAHVRFGVLDKNKDGAIDWEEYLATGLRGFERWDTDNNGVVDANDPLPAPRVAQAREEKPKEKKSTGTTY